MYRALVTTDVGCTSARGFPALRRSSQGQSQREIWYARITSGFVENAPLRSDFATTARKDPCSTKHEEHSATTRQLTSVTRRALNPSLDLKRIAQPFDHKPFAQRPLFDARWLGREMARTNDWFVADHAAQRGDASSVGDAIAPRPCAQPRCGT